MYSSLRRLSTASQTVSRMTYTAEDPDDWSTYEPWTDTIGNHYMTCCNCCNKSLIINKSHPHNSKSKSIYLNKVWTHRSQKTLTHAQQMKTTEQWDTQAYADSTSTKGVKSINSSLCLNTEMLHALTISLDKLFQISITRYAKIYFRTSSLHWGLNNIKLCPQSSLLATWPNLLPEN